jgi:hypothetical protein
MMTTKNVPITVAAHGSCPQGSAYPDGCPGAQAAGTAAITNFFTTYTNFNYGSSRPPWNVSGVDYPVGHDNGTLRDPANITSLAGGCAVYSAGAVSITGTCTIDHFDFSLHNGVCVSTAGSGTITFTNNNFLAGTNCEPFGGAPFSFGGTATHVFEYNTVDLGYNTSTEAAIISVAGTGPVMIEYNDFRRTVAAYLDLRATATYTVAYNYAQGLNGNACGVSPNNCHTDWFIFNSNGVTQTMNESFNVVYGDSASSSGTAFCYMSGNAGVVLQGFCNNDTYIDQSGTAYPVRWEPGANTGNVTFNNNYIDSSGGNAPFESRNSGGSGGTAACVGNKDIRSGAAAITGSFGPLLICN